MDWYVERVKESRTRLAIGSADSAEALLLLMRYARRRRDVYTLRRLRTSVAAWTQQHREQASLRSDDVPKHEPLLLTRLDNTLFGLAAEQDNWSVMHNLVKSRNEEHWTPFMCRAMLRTKGALQMVTGEAHVADAAQTLSDDERHARNALWSHFLDEFGMQIRRAQTDLSKDKSRVFTPLPTWIVAALLDLYARSCRAHQALALANVYLTSLPVESEQAPRVLRAGPSHLITDPDAPIPGPTLLHTLLSAFVRAGEPHNAGQIFEKMARTPLPGPASPSGPLLPLDTRFLFEPDVRTVLLAMDAVAATAPSGRGEAMLVLLQTVERTWGVLSPDAAHRTPLLLDARPFTKLLHFARNARDTRLVRRVLRFQYGALRRELRWRRWHGSTTARTVPIPNEYALLKRWEAELGKLRKHGYLDAAHAQALVSLATFVTAQRHAAARRAASLQGMHTQKTSL
ncbi:hypothetical protein MBRA1_002394 [Malassezia brasiliensis]|uniref:Uncharacterized protein n=1 Tax=Malassezia brasiliensis TaxID=1821822 RepID=A0AAF0DY88_9BASI|nr:hypothetical protein MBRA1_002394 [Malassezia brasiliensis]